LTWFDCEMSDDLKAAYLEDWMDSASSNILARVNIA
jgi:hypothetical protein